MTWRDDLEQYRQFEAHEGMFAERAASATPNLATDIAKAMQMNPTMSPDEVVGLMLGGGDPDFASFIEIEKAKMTVARGVGPDGNRIRNQQDLNEDANRNLFEYVGGGIKHTAKMASRSVFLGFDTLYNTAVGTLSIPLMSPGFRQRVSAEGLGGFIGYLADIPTGSTGWIAAAQLLSGEGVDMGSGYFVEGTVQEQQARRQKELLGEITRGEESFAWTPGRGFANLLSTTGVISDESWAWTVASGTVDAFVAIFLDPSNLVPGVGWGDDVIKGVRAVGSKRMNQYVDLIKRAEEAEKVGDLTAALQLRTRAADTMGVNEKFMTAQDLNPTEAALRDMISQELGMSVGGMAKDVDQASFLSFLTKKSGRRLVERMVEDSSAENIMALHRHKIGVHAAKDLAAAKTADDVVAIYLRTFTDPGEDLKYMLQAVPDMGVFRSAEKGLWVRNQINSSTRWGRMLPESSVLDPTNPNDYVATLRKLLDVFPIGVSEPGAARYARDLRETILNDAIDVMATGDRAAIYDLNNRLAERFADMFTNLGYTDESVKSLTTWRTSGAEYLEFAMKDIAAGVKQDRMPLMVSQLLSGGAAIIDPKQLREVLRNAGRLKQALRTNEKFGTGKRYYEKQDQIKAVRGQMEDARAIGDLSEVSRQNNVIRNLNKELDSMRSPEKALPLELMKGVGLAGDFLMGQVWKPLQLVRAAFVVRVVAEETLRVLASGAFGGKGSIVEYLKATTSKSGSYNIDGAGRRFTVKGIELDELEFTRQDYFEELQIIRAELRRAGGEDLALKAQINELDLQVKDLDNQIRFVIEELDASEAFFRKSQLNSTPGMAYDSITKNSKRVLYRDGIAQNVNRNKFGEDVKWKEAIVDRLLKFNADPVMSRLAAGVGDKVTITIGGKRATVAEHFADNPILTDQDILTYWLQTTKDGRRSLDAMSNAFRVEGKAFDPDNFTDVRRWVDTQTDELLYVIGGQKNGLGQIVDFDEDLLRIVSAGRFRGENVLEMDFSGKKKNTNRTLMDHLEEFRINDNAPDWMEYISPAIYGDDKKGLEKFVSYFFSQVYGTASDKLARSPTFRRVYWKQMAQLVGRMDPADAQKVLDSARKAKINKRLLDDIEVRVSQAKGTVEFDTLDGLAKGAALAATRDLLFDAAKRGATFDQMRLIMPFGDAWKEVTQTWARLFVDQRGANLYRGLRNARALMGADVGPFGVGDLYGIDPLTNEYTATPDGKREGFIYTDPTSKEKRIAVPFSQQVSKFLAKTGVFGDGVENFPGVGFGIPVQNLSIAGGFLPGIGPVADRLIDDALPQDPGLDWLRKSLFPFGSPSQPDTPGGRQGIEEVVLPAWFQKMSALLPREGITGWVANLINDIETDPVFQSTLSQVYSQLVSTGDYTTAASDQLRAQEDAKTVARKIYAFRGLLQGIGPGSPLSQYMASTEDGDVLAALLVEQLRTFEEALVANGQSPTLALPMIMDTYGPNVWLYAAPNSVSEYRGVSAKDSWWDWYRTEGNDSAIAKYSEFGSFFGPDDGEFSIEAYGSMRSQGLNRPATPTERYEIASRALGFMAYNRFRNGLPPESQRSNFDVLLLGRARQNIEQYFNVSLESTESRTRRKKQINQAVEILRAADSGDRLAQQLMSQPVGESLRIYLGARERVERVSVQEFGSANWQTRQVTASLREFLRKLGDQLSLQDAAFAKMFQYVFDGEMIDDLETSDA